MEPLTRVLKRLGWTNCFAAGTVLLLSLTLLLVGASSDKTAAAANANTGRMMSSRAASCAVMLKDGRILITGGEAGKSILSSTEFFSVRSGASNGPAMSIARSEHACAAL